MESRIAEVIAEINGAFKQVVVRSAMDIPEVSRVPIMQPAVDFVMGGGVPINRMVEFYGVESSFKSYCAYCALGEFQKFDWNSMTPRAITKVDYEEKSVRTKTENSGTIEQSVWVPKKIHTIPGIKNPEYRTVALVDYENSFDPEWGKHLGIDVKGMLHLVPERGSQVVDLVETLLMQSEISLIVLDSIGAASSDLELDASAEDEQMGVNARFWNKAARKFQAAMNSNPDNYVTLLIINRPYSKIGFVMGSPEALGGGSGLKFGKAVSVRFTPLAEIKGEKVKGEKESEITIGRNVKVKCMKNKTHRPFLEGEFYFSYVETEVYQKDKVDEISQLVTIGIRTGIIVRSGNFYKYGDDNVNGREKFYAHLRENKLIAKLRKDVYAEFQ